MAWIAGESWRQPYQGRRPGVIGTGNADADWLKQEIDIARQITDRVFAVNLMLASPHVQEIVELIVAEKIPVVTTEEEIPGYLWKAQKRKYKGFTGSASLAPLAG